MVAGQSTESESTRPTYTLGAHLATAHSAGGFCDFNPGLYLVHASGAIVGTYRNSDCRASAYAGWTWRTSSGHFGLTAGVVTGYIARPVMPMVVPSLRLPIDRVTAARLAFIPRIEKRGAHALHLSIERSF